jgi:hypothetical protein
MVVSTLGKPPQALLQRQLSSHFLLIKIKERNEPKAVQVYSSLFGFNL